MDEFVGFPEHAAVFNDDIPALIAALSKPDADVAFQHLDAGTPLALAISLGRSAIVAYLLSKFDVAKLVDISRYSDFDAALSFSAAQNCDEPTFVLLVKAGVVELEPIQRHNGSTLCHFAALNADARVLARLVACGLPFDESNDADARPSHSAATNSYSVAALQTLIDAGCDLQACDHQGDSLAHHAARNSNEAAIVALVAAGGASLSAQNGMAIAPIHVAAENPNDAVIRTLIAAGVDLNVVDVNDNCPCYIACRNSNHNVLQRLLAAGATLRHARESDGCSPCHEAARNHNLEVMKILIERGMDVNARNQDKGAPLHEAAHMGSAAMVALLLDAGATVDVVDSSLETPCHCAARNTDPGVMRALIAAGADFRSSSINDNMTPIAIAISCDNVSAIKVLIEAGVDLAAEIAAAPIELLRQAAQCRLGLSIRLLIQYGADYRLMTSDGLTACHWSSSGALVTLFALGFDLNMPAADGQPAICSAESERFQTLIAAGVLLDVRSTSEHRNISAIDIACLNVVTAPPLSLIHTDCWRWTAFARQLIATRQKVLLRARALEVCIGLQSLELPALLTCEILTNAFAPRESFVPFHFVWEIVTKVKHFRGT